MRLKKSIFGLVVGIVQGIVIALLLGVTLYDSVSKTVMLQGTEELPLYLGVAVTIFALLCLRFAAGRLQGKGTIPKAVKTAAEILAVTAILAGAIYLRLRGMGTLFNSGEHNVFYEMAVVQLDRPELYLPHNAHQFYGNILKLLLSLLGNEAMMCFYLQLVLQCLILVCLYGIVRNMNGSFAALFAAAVMAVLPSFMEASYTLSPEMLYLFLFLLVFYLISVVWKYNREGEYKSLPDMMVFASVGFLSGVIIFMDISGFLLLLTAVAGICLSSRKPLKKEFATPLIKSLFFGIGALFGAALLLLIKALTYGLPLEQPFVEYLSLLNQRPTLSLLQIQPASGSTVISVILLLIAAVWLIRYRKADRDEAVPYSLCLMGAMVSTAVLTHALDYQMLLLTAWVMSAAAGLGSLVHSYDAVPERKRIKIAEMKEDEDTVPQEEIKPALNLIPNPLPLPKKHIRKEMDYAFVPKEEQMHYDIEQVKEDDNFEI